jgi:hypothetical protein
MEDGEGDFFVDMEAPAEKREWGSSLSPWQPAMASDKRSRKRVRHTDLARFVREEMATRRRAGGATTGGNVLMKLDIEGHEHMLLPRLIITGAMCAINMTLLEVHPRDEEMFSGVTDQDFTYFFHHFLLGHPMRDCPAEVRFFDDEVFGDSDFPLPPLPKAVPGSQD